MKRRMSIKKNDGPPDRGPGKAADPEGKFKVKDPGRLAERATTKKAEKRDVSPTRNVPADRGTGTKTNRMRLRNVRI